MNYPIIREGGPEPRVKSLRNPRYRTGFTHPATRNAGMTPTLQKDNTHLRDHKSRPPEQKVRGPRLELGPEADIKLGKLQFYP